MELVFGSINTGYASPTQISFHTTSTVGAIGTERMRIESDGDVVLTEGNLTMSGATPFITLSNTAETECGITLLDSADAGQSAKITYDAGSSNALKFYNNATNERMSITSGGQINMGTSTNYHQFEPEADMDFNFIMNAGQVNASPNYTIKSSTSGGAITSRLLLIGSTGNMTITGSLTQNGSISDISLKENIKPVENALDKIEKLNAVTFDWKKSDSILQLKEDYGFIAQEVEKVIPEIVRTNDDDKKAINYNGITSVLVKAIQELKAEVDLLKNKCNCK